MPQVETCPTSCPHCGEPIELVVDSSNAGQSYIEDCEVCCRPILIRVDIDSEGDTAVSVARENE